MSCTVVVDEAERERRFENRLNATFRHCRIGKVISKRPVSVPTVFPMPSWPRTTPPMDDWLKGIKVTLPRTTHDVLGDQRQRVTVGDPNWFEQVRV